MTTRKGWVRSTVVNYSQGLLFYTLPKILIEHAHALNPQNLRNSDEIGRKGLRQKFHTLKLVSPPRNPTYIQLHGDLSKHKLKSSYQDFQHYKPELEERVLTFSLVPNIWRDNYVLQSAQQNMLILPHLSFMTYICILSTKAFFLTPTLFCIIVDLSFNLFDRCLLFLTADQNDIAFYIFLGPPYLISIIFRQMSILHYI